MQNIDVRQLNEFRSQVILEPLKRGFGHTLGNMFRRVLLSSMPGAAIVEAQIDNVAHEYSAIEGVREDVVDILLNLKGLAIKLHNRQDVTLTIDKKGSSVVTARDILLEHNVEILNPDHVIAHINKDGKLKMQLKVAVGCGYVPAISRLSEAQEGTAGAAATSPR